jgi:hypothetical protein
MSNRCLRWKDGVVAGWQRKAETRFRSRVALQLMGVSFLAVAFYVA